eukprot:4321164-Pyramimonas_sp.AAC.1
MKGPGYFTASQGNGIPHRPEQQRREHRAQIAVHRPSPAGKAHQKYSAPKQAVLGLCRAFEGEQRIVPAVGGAAFWVFKETPPPEKAEVAQLVPGYDFFARARFPRLTDLMWPPPEMRSERSMPAVGFATSTLVAPDWWCPHNSWHLIAGV